MSFEDICPRCGESGHKKYTYNGMELFACPKCDPNEPYVYQLANRDVVKVKTPDNASFQVFPEQQAQEWAFNESANLDIDCPIVTSGNDEELCSECRHIYWAAVRGYIAGHAAGKQDARERLLAQIEEAFDVHTGPAQSVYGEHMVDHTIMLLEKIRIIFGVNPEIRDLQGGEKV